MNTIIRSPLQAALSIPMPGDLRILHEAACELGGAAGAAVQIATILPIPLHKLGIALIEDIDFEEGTLRIPCPIRPDGIVALGRSGLEIVVAAAGGRDVGGILDDGGENAGRHLPATPGEEEALTARLRQIDPRLAGLQWTFTSLRLAVYTMMRKAGVPREVMSAQSGHAIASHAGILRQQTLFEQRMAADTTAAALNLFTRPARQQAPLDLPLSPIDHIRAIRCEMDERA